MSSVPARARGSRALRRVAPHMPVHDARHVPLMEGKQDACVPLVHFRLQRHTPAIHLGEQAQTNGLTSVHHAIEAEARGGF